MKRAISLGAVVALVPLLVGCTGFGGPVATSTPADGATTAELAPFYEQVLSWESCENTLQCATATAPLDWDDPTGESIELALIRQPTSGTKLGSLLVNPGGPGASGYDFLAAGASGAVDERLQQNFDIVGWDPRGVGRSSAVTCSTEPDQLDDYYFGVTPGGIGSDEWFDAGEEASAIFADACLEQTGDLLGHVDTASSARDLDMLRSALGDNKLNYLGYSYGTFIGAVYAEMFPDKTGRLVLDGAVDPAETAVDVNETQSKGFESAFRAYLQSCIGRPECPFTGTVDGGVSTVSRLFDTLDASPLRNADGRELGSSTMSTAIIAPLYSEASWPVLTQLLSAVLAGDPTVAFAVADSYFDRSSDGTYASNLIEAFTATNCLDQPATESRDQVRADAARLADSAPLFGSRFGYGGSACSEWPFPATRKPAPIAAAGSADILVLGTTNDPATPYENAESLASQLENGHLVSLTGEGHTAYNGGSECIDNAVDDYFIDGTVPSADPEC